jgi:hypothetical protein
VRLQWHIQAFLMGSGTQNILVHDLNAIHIVHLEVYESLINFDSINTAIVSLKSVFLQQAVHASECRLLAKIVDFVESSTSASLRLSSES